MKPIKIDGQFYNLQKNLQDFVKYTMQKLLESNSISEDELQNLQDKDYCKETFNLKYPLLSKSREAYATDKDHPRYYSKDGFYVNGFYLCNDWYEDRNEKFFSDWLKTLA